MTRSPLASPRVTRALLALCAGASTGLAAPALQAAETVVWVQADKASLVLQKKIQKQLGDALDGREGLTFARLKGPPAKALTKLAKSCKPIGDPACVTSALALVEGRGLLVVTLRGKAPHALEVQLVDPQGQTLARHQGTWTPGKVKAQIAALADAVVLAVQQAAAPPPEPAPEAAIEPPPLPAPPDAPAEPPPETAAAAPAPPESPPMPEGSAVADPNAAASAAPPSEPVAEIAAIESEDPTAPEAWLDEDAEILHAQALLAEADGDVPGALALLRRAHTARPELRDVSYDLARIAFETHSATLAEDAAGLLALEERNERERLLEAYVRVRLGDATGAAAALQPLLVSEQSETGQLRASLAPKAAAAAPSWYGVRLQLRGEGDSNVTVLPDDAPTRDAGARVGLDASARLTPIDGALRLDVELGVGYALHLNDREREVSVDGEPATVPHLSQYDVAQGLAMATLTYTGDGWTFTTRASGAEVLLNPVEEGPPDGEGRTFGHYLQSGALLAEVRGVFESFSVGGFAQGGYRDFIYQNPETQPGTRREPGDRDGANAQAGLVFAWGNEQVDVRARAAGFAEFAEGRRERVRGGRASAAVRYRIEGFSIDVGAGYELRHYPRAGDRVRGLASKRWDHRAVPSLRLQYDINERIGVFGTYAFLLNVSTHPFSYQRHLGGVGVEARW